MVDLKAYNLAAPMDALTAAMMAFHWAAWTVDPKAVQMAHSRAASKAGSMVVHLVVLMVHCLVAMMAVWMVVHWELLKAVSMVFRRAGYWAVKSAVWMAAWMEFLSVAMKVARWVGNLENQMAEKTAHLRVDSKG
jgi:hypothetical protein